MPTTSLSYVALPRPLRFTDPLKPVFKLRLYGQRQFSEQNIKLFLISQINILQRHVYSNNKISSKKYR